MLEWITIFFNSPLIIVGFFVLSLVYFLVRKLFFGNRCNICRQGKLIEVAAIPQSIQQHHYSNANSHHSTMQILTKVKYRCSHCDEFYETTQNR